MKTISRNLLLVVAMAWAMVAMLALAACKKPAATSKESKQGFERFVVQADNRTDPRFFNAADLVAIAIPVSTKVTNEWRVLGGYNVAGVLTEFDVRRVMKGDANLKKFLLHHYVFSSFLSIPAVFVPILISFEEETDPASPGYRRQQFMLYLKKSPEGYYDPVSSQYPTISIVKLLSPVP